MTSQMSRTHVALEILGKWRVLFAGWQLGTRAKGDPECDAVRDHREATIMLRAQVTALILLLTDKELIDSTEWAAALEKEAKLLNADYEKRFPGVTASKSGLNIDERALAWMKGWKP